MQFENIHQIYIPVLFYIYIYIYIHRPANVAPEFKPFTVEVQWLLLLLKLMLAARLKCAHFCFNVSQMSMNVPEVDTLATVQPHISTLLDPTYVPVTILLREMEKLAAEHQVSSFCLIATLPTLMTAFRNYSLLECTFRIERVLNKTGRLH